jgi:dTDP-4-amino-4,6-dideoxygalactose transaminase
MPKGQDINDPLQPTDALGNRLARGHGCLALGLDHPGPLGGTIRFESSYHLMVIEVEKRDAFFVRLREKGLGVQVHYIPVHLHPYYQQRLGWRPGDLPRAETYYQKAISLPLFPSLTDEEVGCVIAAVKGTAQELGIA